jgi:hypothetical protein
MAVGTTRNEPLTARSPTAQAGHVRFGRRFVEEDEPVGRKLTLPGAPLLPRGRHIGPTLFGCMERLFLYVSPKAARA